MRKITYFLASSVDSIVVSLGLVVIVVAAVILGLAAVLPVVPKQHMK